MAYLTIHTATYNRAYILGKAYESLCRQTCKDFEWIITDDGSTDCTQKLVSSWLLIDNGFEIVYNPLSHVGIPRALNSGVFKANTDWFMMLDSDDQLVPEAVEMIISWLKEIDTNSAQDRIGGVGFCRCFPDGAYMKKQKPIVDSTRGYIDATHLEREKYNFNMDCCEVHRTSLLKMFPFQVWETEKYAPEQICFYSIAMAGWKLRWRDEKLYICEYLPDGQTRDNKLVANNPMGFAMMYNQNLLIHTSILKRIRDAMQMVALCFASNSLSFLKKSNDKMATLVAMLPGLLLGIRRKYQFKKLLK